MAYELGSDNVGWSPATLPSIGDSDAIWTDNAGTAHRIVLSTPAWINKLDPRITKTTAALVENATIACAQYD